MKKGRSILCVVCLVVVATFLLRGFFRPVWEPLYFELGGMKTIGTVVGELEGVVLRRLRPALDSVGLDYPPASLALLVFKEEKELQVWGKDSGSWEHVCDYAILGASGAAGPKLNEGDLQVPEGIYRVVALHPNSLFHLSLKLDYPNKFDLDKALQDGRSQLGGDIFIHGGASSIGCIAVGDKSIEDLFVLVSQVGLNAVDVIIAPRDFRSAPPQDDEYRGPVWQRELYQMIQEALLKYVLPPGE